MKTKKLALSILPEKLAVCRFDEKSPIPDWVLRGNFFSITKTLNELSVVCPQENVPGGVLFEGGWKAFKLENVGDIYSVGIIASLSVPLAKAKISIFNISTYETNYIMVEEKNMAKAKKVLAKLCEIKG